MDTVPSTLKMFQATNIAQNMAQPVTCFRTTTPSTPAMSDTTTTKQVNPVHVHQETSHKALLESQAPTQCKDFCEQTPIDEARHSVTIFQLL